MPSRYVAETPIAHMPRRSGVYQIRNLITGRIYVGASCNLYMRATIHLAMLRSGRHYARLMQADYDRYGPSSFEFSVLCKCDPEIRFKVESHLIRRMQPAYCRGCNDWWTRIHAA